MTFYLSKPTNNFQTEKHPNPNPDSEPNTFPELASVSCTGHSCEGIHLPLQLDISNLAVTTYSANRNIRINMMPYAAIRGGRGLGVRFRGSASEPSAYLSADFSPFSCMGCPLYLAKMLSRSNSHFLKFGRLLLPNS